MKVTYRAKALADIDSIVRYVETESLTGARNVGRAIYESIQIIARQPYSGEQTTDPKIRVGIIRRYRYKIFYSIVDAATIRIIHVRHTSRRLWREE